MRRLLTMALSGLVISCPGPAAVMAQEVAAGSPVLVPGARPLCR